ncbi:MAG: hypothetical protein HYT65_01245 [Candidatus Yanofskybacteria bacterium]|nr:hypothetical protein [Candidatus Yanofskybacteria bacterium]
MTKPWVRRHKLAYVLIATPILGFVLFLIIGHPLETLFGVVLAGFVAYKYILPLADRFVDSVDAYALKLKNRRLSSKN